ncbi:MAG: quinolinate synthase NadA [Planctomycetota bacterium]
MDRPSAAARRVHLDPELPICQADLPLDWYQEELRPYAEEYLALSDRRPATVLGWMDRYIAPACDHFGDALFLLAHYYMGGEIVKLVETFGGRVADSYQLALQARDRPEKKVIVESAVHFMAESIAILARDDQEVWITNPKAGCTMELLAKDHMVLPVADQLLERYGDELLVVAYMNTSGRLKALAGRTGGAVCTSANAHLLLRWALDQGKKVFFLPDHHLGRNASHRLGVPVESLVTLPDPREGAIHLDDGAIPGGLAALDAAPVVLWGSHCGVHSIFTPAMVRHWQERGWRVLIHPESPLEAVILADGAGSTSYLWQQVLDAPPGAKLAIGTEGHFVRNAVAAGRARGVEIRHLADVPGFAQAGCGCATMSRNDPPHLAGLLDLLRRGKGPDINRVLAGDVVNERTMQRERLAPPERAALVREARAAMERMIEVVEAARG